MAFSNSDSAPLSRQSFFGYMADGRPPHAEPAPAFEDGEAIQAHDPSEPVTVLTTPLGVPDTYATVISPSVSTLGPSHDVRLTNWPGFGWLHDMSSKADDYDIPTEPKGGPEASGETELAGDWLDDLYAKVASSEDYDAVDLHIRLIKDGPDRVLVNITARTTVYGRRSIAILSPNYILRQGRVRLPMLRLASFVRTAIRPLAKQ